MANTSEILAVGSAVEALHMPPTRHCKCIRQVDHSLPNWVARTPLATFYRYPKFLQGGHEATVMIVCHPPVQLPSDAEVLREASVSNKSYIKKFKHLSIISAFNAFLAT
jgi:hypothetical protein